MDDRDFSNMPLDLPGADENPKSHLHSSPPRKPKKRLVIIILLVILIATGAGFVTYKNQQDTSVGEQTPAQDSQVEQPQLDNFNDVPEVSETTTHRSDFPRMEFTRPASWKVTEESGGVRIESQEFNYTSFDGEEITGNFRIYIRQGARAEDSEFIGRGLASLKSEEITYTDPVIGQLPETNLLFFGLDTSDHFAFFFISGFYSLDKDEALGPDFGKEPEAYIIAGGYSSPELEEDMATHKVSLDYFQTTRAYAQAVDIIKSLKLI